LVLLLCLALLTNTQTTCCRSFRPRQHSKYVIGLDHEANQNKYVLYNYQGSAKMWPLFPVPRNPQKAWPSRAVWTTAHLGRSANAKPRSALCRQPLGVAWQRCWVKAVAMLGTADKPAKQSATGPFGPGNTTNNVWEHDKYLTHRPSQQSGHNS